MKNNHKVRNTQKSEMICPSCGAKYESEMVYCPYCGTANESRAEKHYMNQMRDIVDDMADLNDVSRETAIHETKRQGILIGKTLACLAVLFILFFLLYTVSQKLHSSRDTSDSKDTVQWINTYSEELNTLYDEGRYDELMEKIENDEACHRGINNWRYSDFYYCYYVITDTIDLKNRIERGEKLEKYDLAEMLENQLDISHYKDSGHEFSKYYSKIASKAEEAVENMEEFWKMTPEKKEELNAYYKTSYSHIPYDVVNAYVDTWLENGGMSE